MPPMQLRLTTIGGASLRTSSQHRHECTTKSMKSAKVPELFPSDHDELRRWPEARRESLAPGAVAANFHEGSRSEYLAQYVFAMFGTSVLGVTCLTVSTRRARHT